MTLQALQRFLAPRSVAVVGASDRSDRYALTALRDGPVDVHFVNPSVTTVLGEPAYPDLSAIGREVDAVFSLVNAARSVEVVEAAAKLGAGGVVVQAAGFREAGSAGSELERRLATAARAADLPVLGPNCNGFINLPAGAFLSGAPRLNAEAGTIGLISHSGGFLLDVANAGAGRGVGFSTLISTGNEATTDLVDYLEYLIADPATAVMGLVIEAIRRPDAFFELADRALAVGKPIVALKLGRSAVARRLAATHTGAVAGDDRVYDEAFAQHGIVAARDVGDLVDRAAIFAQIPCDRWTSVDRLAVITMSGGAAALCGDIAEQEGLRLPELTAVAPAVTEHVPNATVFNPVDLTGFARGRSDVVAAVIRAYAEAADAVLMVWTLSPVAGQFGLSVAEPFVGVAAEAGIPMVLADAGDTIMGEWTADYPAQGAAVIRGIRPALRGLAGLSQFVVARSRKESRRPPRSVPSRPPDEAWVATPAGRMLRFGETMRLLAAVGIPVSPYVEVPANQAEFEVLLDGPLVAKLADVPHRSDLGAVRLGLRRKDVPAAVAELRALAHDQQLPADVVVQPMVDRAAEFFIGADTTSELGPVVACGLGGVHIELLKRFSVRRSPLTGDDPAAMVRASGAEVLLGGFRGAPAWDLTAVYSTILAVDDLARAGWISAIDLNPILLTETGPAAVDALIMARD